MAGAVRRVFRFLLPAERARYWLITIAKSLTGLLDVFGIVLIGFIASIAATQFTAHGGEGTTLFGMVVPHLSAAALLWLVVLVLVVFTLKAVIAIGLTSVLARFMASLEVRNASALTAFILGSRLDEVKRYSKADVQFAVTGSTTYAFTGILNNVASFMSEGFLLLVITATFFVVDPIAALFTLVYFSLVVFIIQVFIGRRLKRAGVEAVAGTIDTMDTLGDTIDAFREITVLQKREFFIAKVTLSRQRISESDATMTFLAGMPRYVVETALILGVVLLVGQQFFSGQLATGLANVGVFLAGGVRMMASLLPLQSSAANIKQNVEKSRLALDMLDRSVNAAAVQLGADGPAECSGIAIIESPLAVLIDNVRYRYPGSSEDAVRGASLKIDPGQYVAIIGPSGAGKTTLVDLILGLSEPTTGSVLIGGESPAQIRKLAPGSVSYVPQKPGIVTGTIAENIALGVPVEHIDGERLQAAVESAFLSDLIASLPDGVNTSVGKQGDALSGGQIQRIGVARALYNESRLLILDEATSALDAASEAFVADSIRKLHGSVTVIVIAHRLSTVQHADVVHVIEGGKVTASGDFKTVKATVPTIAEYVKLMSFDDE